MLGGTDYGSRVNSPDGEGRMVSSHVQLLSFSEVMNSAMIRSYFMRYLKKLNISKLLKFWNEVIYMINFIFDLILTNFHPKISIIQTSQPTGKDLARLISHAYQTYIVHGGAEELDIGIDKATTKGMQECVVGEKTPEDFFTVQKQVFIDNLLFLSICYSGCTRL